jgi:Tol biopolymer transport system component
MRKLLAYVAASEIEGRGGQIKETVIGVEVFGRDPGYDPKIDGIVRTEVRRLRQKLLEYYLGSGKDDPVRIELPKGSYVPVFVQSPELRVAAAAPASRWRMWAVAAGLVAAVAAVALGGLLAGNRERGNPPLPHRFETGSGNARSPVFSPDGARLAYSVDGNGLSHIFAAPLPGGPAVAWTDGPVIDYEPAWSPDGHRIAFLRALPERRYELRIARSPGDSFHLAEIAARDAIDWSRDGKWIATADQVAQDAPKAIFLIDPRSGAKRQVTAPPRDSLGDGAPRFSPDSSHIGFVRSVTDGADDVYVASLAPAAGSAPRRIASMRSRIGVWSWMPSGDEILIAASRGDTPRSLWRVKVSDGSMRRIAETGLAPMTPAVSRGGRVAWATVFQDTNIWRFTLDGSEPDRGIVTSSAPDTSPQISPDGRLLAFRSSRSGFNEIWISDIDGQNERQLTSMRGPVTGSPRWSPDGKFLVFDSRAGGNADIYRIAVSGGAPIRLTSDPSNETVPSWSRDGRYIYFASDQGGRQQVFRMPAGGGAAQAITREGGGAAFESQDGEYLYYARGPQQPGLWRIALRHEGAAEETVIPDLDKAMWGSWALAANGIYYVRRSRPTPVSRWQIAFQSFDGETRVIRDLERQPVLWDNTMALAPDQKTLFFTTLDSAGSDIYILDGVR